MLTLEMTIKDLVTQDFRTAAVFQKYGLDFCCGGAVAIDEACRKNGLDAPTVQKDLEQAMTGPADVNSNPANWPVPQLIDHIVGTHHVYVRSILPVLLQHATKVARVHGYNHPETEEIAQRVSQVAGEMTQHMQKEEIILFPYIKELWESHQKGQDFGPSPFGTVRNPIAMMEDEHQSAGDETASIRTLSNNYTPPPDACATFRVLYQELAQFEADLHRHVHLENNILFPKAIEMERN